MNGVVLHGHFPAFTIHTSELCKTFIHARGKWMILNLKCQGEGQTREHVEVSNEEIAETFSNIEKDPDRFDQMFPSEEDRTMSNLKSVDEYNAEKRAEREAREKKLNPTGVACPGCGRELQWKGILTLASGPVKTRTAVCSCGMSVELDRG